MQIATYRIIDRNTNRVVFVGTDNECRKEFDIKSHVHTYITKGRFLKGKYRIEQDGFVNVIRGEYEELLAEQMSLLQRYDSVVGHSKNIERNISDLKRNGFDVVKRQAFIKFGKRRKQKYWILEKA